MIKFLAVIGALHLLLIFTGALGLNDYHLCVKYAGGCSVVKSK